MLKGFFVRLALAAVLISPARAAAQSAAGREGFADLPGARVWFTDTGGSGVPVILLHAATGNTGSWAQQMPALTAAG